MATLKNIQVAEIALRAAVNCLEGNGAPFDIEVVKGDPEATDGNFTARWKQLTEKELQLAVRMLDYAGYDIVRRESYRIAEQLCSE